VSERRSSPAPLIGGGIVVVVIGAMLGVEFFDSGNISWDMFLGLFLIGLAVAAVPLGRFFLTHSAEIGEARFDTANRGEG
jgi:hypothetical protein